MLTSHHGKAAFVLDASVALAAVLPDEAEAARANRILDRITVEGAIVPSLWRAEVGNTLLVQERRNNITVSETARITVQLDSLPILMDLEGAAQVWEQALSLARRHRLTLYDALYLELALRKRLPLASFDAKLCAASTAEQVIIVTGAPT